MYVKSHSPGAVCDPPAALHTRDAVPFVTVRDLFWFLYLYPIRFVAGLAPAGFLYPLARMVPLYARKRRAEAARRIREVPGLRIPAVEAGEIASKFLVNSSIRMLDDLLLTLPSFARKIRCEGMEGMEHLERGLAAGRGIILLSTHFCATHVAKSHLSSAGHRILTVRDRLQEGDWWGRLGRRLLAPRRLAFLESMMGEAVHVQDPGFTLKILGTLRSGGLVSIHFDGQSGTRLAPGTFLGVPRRFSTGILDMVRLSGCTVIPAAAFGRASGFRIVFGPMLDIVQAADREQFIRANLPLFVQAIEEQVRTCPEEWEQWMSI